jgi:hypothetical protein
MTNNIIRIIIQSSSKKLLNDIDNLKQFIDKFDLIIIDEIELSNEINNIEKYKYNLHIDTIDENIYTNYPCDITLLYVNNEYVIFEKYLKRVIYKDYPLVLIKNVVDLYITNSDYSKNILINEHKIKSDNIIFIKVPESHILIKNNKYKNIIYFKPDIYSYQKNINLLKIWIKYYLSRKEKLVIHYTRYNDKLVSYFKKISGIKINLFGINYYKNIIIFKDDKFYNNYKNNIMLSIINYSNYNIYNVILYNISQKINMITYDNALTRELLPNNKIFLNSFEEDDIKKTLNIFFNEKT